MMSKCGEIADVIAIKVDDVNKKVKVELFHLKFSQEDRPGARINDLYAVNGASTKMCKLASYQTRAYSRTNVKTRSFRT